MKKAFILMAAFSLACSAAFAAAAAAETTVPAKKTVKAVTHVKKVVKEEAAPVKKAPVLIGMKTGLTATTVSTNETDGNYNFGLNRVSGVFFEIPMGKTLVLQPEVLFAKRTIGIDTGDTYKEAIKASGIEIPVLFKAKFGVSGAACRPTVFVGPQLGILTSARMQDWDDTGSEFTNMLISGHEIVNRTSFDGVVGAGLDCKKVTVDLRFALGLANMAKDDSGEMSVKSRSFELAVGYLFN